MADDLAGDAGLAPLSRRERAPASRKTTMRCLPEGRRAVTVTRLASPPAALSENETAVPSSSVSSETETVAARAAGAQSSVATSAAMRARHRTGAT